MDRRRFTALAAAAIFTGNPRQGAAGDARSTPAAAHLPGLERGVYREFVAAGGDPGAPGDEPFIYLLAVGARFATPEDVRRAMDLSARDVARPPASTVEVEVGPLGDDRLGLSQTVPASTSPTGTDAVYDLLMLRKERQFQLLLGLAPASRMHDLAGIARELDGRWPSRDVWDIVPGRSNLPGRMDVRDEGPWDPVVPADVAATPAGDEATPAPGRGAGTLRR
jgi:hypothetical protein